MADWSMLPCDFLGDIALRLDYVEDFIFFSTVCHSWHRAHTMVKETWTLRMRKPWLLLAESTKDNPNHCRNLFCSINKQCYQLKLPQTFGARCWGSSSGWVVTFDLNLEFHLLNPFTRRRIALPPQPTMPHHEEFEGCDPVKMRRCYADKILVFGDDDDYIVIALYGAYNGFVAYVRPEDQAWTPLLTWEMFKESDRQRGRARPHDVVQMGSDLFFMFFNGTLGYCDVSKLEGNSQPIMILEYLSPPLEILDELFKGLYKIYLVDSFGDLLMVLRFKEEIIENGIDGVNYETIGFDVYKLDFGSKMWEEVDDLGDVSLFVGCNSSMSVRASSINNYECNCIYFTDDEWQFWTGPLLFGGHDFGVFRMENSKIDKIYEGHDARSAFCAPTWFMPNFF